MIATYYPAMVVVALSAFAMVLLFTSIEDRLKR